MSIARHQIILEPGRADRRYWRDLWAYRELLFFLGKRDVAVHYKQTVIGAAWALIRPLLTVIILTLIFHKVAKLDAPKDIWYPLFILSGQIVWQFFATFMADSANSLVSNANLISKVYFPRMLVPLSSAGVPLVDLLVLLPVLGLFLLIGGVLPPWHVVFVPVFLAFAALTAIGFGLLLCALNVRYRDVRYIIPFVVQFGVLLSPIGFNSDKVPPDLQLLWHMNPLVFAINGMRWSLLGVGDPFANGGWIVSVATTSVALILGIRYFRKTEKSFADVI